MLKNRIYPAAALLVVSAILLAQVTYAWFTLSTSPEVSDITTVLGANGSLEIALATEEHLTSLATNNMYEKGAYTQRATGVLSVDNTMWGNIVDLDDEFYGFNQLTLKPTSLNIIDNAVQDSPITVPKYGRDGRIAYLSNSSASAVYDEKSKSYLVGSAPQYGVRVAGTTANTNLVNTVNQFVVKIDPALKELVTVSDDAILSLYLYKRNESSSYELANLRSVFNSAKALYETVLLTVEPLNSSFKEMFSSIVGEAVNDSKQMKALLDQAEENLERLEKRATEEENFVITANEADKILSVLVGDIKFSYKTIEPAENEGEEDKIVYVPFDTYSSGFDTDCIKVELGSDGIIVLASKLYSEGLELASKKFTEGGKSLIYDISSSDSADIVGTVNTQNMNVEYIEYKSATELGFDTIKVHQDTVASLLREEYAAVQKLFYTHTLAELSSGQEEIYSYDEWITNGIADRVEKLDDELEYIENYIDSAINAYAASGDLPASIYDSVRAVSSGPVTELAAAGLDSETYLIAARSCEQYKEEIDLIISKISALNKSLTTYDSEGNAVSFRDELTYDELKGLWESYLDIDAITTGGYTISEFASHADEVFVDSLYSMDIADDTGIVSMATRLENYGNNNDFELTLSSLAKNSNSNATGYLPGNLIKISLPTYTYTTGEGNKTSEVEGSYLDVVITGTLDKLDSDTEQWEAYYNEFMKSKSTVEENTYGKTASRIAADFYFNYEVSNETNGYDSSYKTELSTLITNYYSLSEQYTTALEDLILLCSVRVDEILEEKKAQEEDTDTETEPEISEDGTVIEPEEEKTVVELVTEAIEEDKTLDELIEIVEEVGEYDLYRIDGFSDCMDLYHYFYNVLNRAGVALSKMSSVSYESISSVMQYFVSDVNISQRVNSVIPANLYSNVYALINDRVAIAANEGNSGVLNNAAENIKNGGYGNPDDENYVELPATTLISKDLSKIISDYELRDLVIGRRDYEYADTEVGTTVNNKYCMYPYYLLTYGNKQVTMNDRQYVYYMANQFMSRYYVHATEYYNNYQKQETAMMNIVNKLVLKEYYELKDTDALCTYSELREAYEAIVSMNKSFESYLDYIEYVMLLKAASADTSEDDFIAAMECKSFTELYALMANEIGDDLHESYTTANAGYEDSYELLREFEKLLGITEGYEDRELLLTSPTVKEIESIIDSYINLSGVTLNGVSADEFAAKLKEKKLAGVEATDEDTDIIGSTLTTFTLDGGETKEFKVGKTGTYSVTTTTEGTICTIYDSVGVLIASDTTPEAISIVAELEGGKKYTISVDYYNEEQDEENAPEAIEEQNTEMIPVSFKLTYSAGNAEGLSNYEEFIQSVGVTIDYPEGLPSKAREIFGYSGDSESLTTEGVSIPWGTPETEEDEQLYISGVNSEASVEYTDNQYLSAIKQAMISTQYPQNDALAGLNTTSNYILADNYCFGIDMLFRTNVDDANLILQTEARQRIYQDVSDRNAYVEEAMQGSGSYIKLENELIKKAIRVVFADTLTGEVYATALVGEDDYLYLKDDQKIITSLNQDQVKAITAWVYIDGRYVDNSAAAVSICQELEMNLQFATDVELIAYEQLIKEAVKE